MLAFWPVSRFEGATDRWRAQSLIGDPHRQGHELGVGAATQQPAFSGLLQGLAQQVTAQVPLVALTDGLRQCHDRQALVSGAARDRGRPARAGV